MSVGPERTQTIERAWRPIRHRAASTQALRSTPEKFDEADWLDIFHPDTFEAYGGGLLLKSTVAASVTGITARNAQNGIGLIGARGSYLAENWLGMLARRLVKRIFES